MGQTDRKAAHGEQMQGTNQSEGIDMQGILATGLRTVVRWRRDGCLTFNGYRHHKLLSITRMLPSFLDQLILLCQVMKCPHERYIGKNHSLLALAQEANINLKSSESALLSKLTETINFWGRYPIPKTKGSWRRKVEYVEGIQPVWTWSEEELKACDALLQRLQERL